MKALLTHEPSKPKTAIDAASEAIDLTKTVKKGVLRLEVSAAEAFPWPGLIIRAAAKIQNQWVRLRNLKLAGNGFRYGGVHLCADPLEVLLVRSILSLPTDDGLAFQARGGRFAPTLALLKQVALAELNFFRYRESERVMGCAIMSEAPEPVLVIEALSGAANLEIRAKPGFQDPDSGRSLGFPLTQDCNWLVFPNAIAPAGVPSEIPVLQRIFEDGPGVFRKSEAWEIVRLALRAGSDLIVKMPSGLAEAATAEAPRPVVTIEASGRARRNTSKLKATLRFTPTGGSSSKSGNGKGKVEEGISAEEFFAAAERGEEVLQLNGRWCKVDTAVVEKARAALRQVTSPNGTPDTFQAADEQIPELLAWAEDQAGAGDSPWNVYVSKAVQGSHLVKDETIEMRFQLDAEEDQGDAWFSISTKFKGGGKALTEEEIEKLIAQRKKWLKKGKQWLRFDADAFQKLQEQAVQYGLKRRGAFGYSFKAESREKVNDLFSLAGTLEHSDSYRSFVQNLRSFKKVEAADLPEGFKLELRSYQLHGFSWMSFLAKYGLNGALADDMGLGKTAQTIAILASMQEKKGPAPSLIICPTSLVDNWCAEVQKFAPGLQTLRYAGSPKRRDRLRGNFDEYDIILATYATVRNDAVLLKEIPWRYVILDEAHAIKNPSAAVTKAVKTIPAQHRLALTGTPIQNRLQELWSIFDFLMPGFLGRHSAFFRQYEETITRGQSGDASKSEKRQAQVAEEMLKNRINPFILRRLKTEVAKELPAKILQDVPCRLTADQVALYHKFAGSEEARRLVRDVEEKGAGLAQIEILTALSSLRKVCNHPDLVHLSSEVAAGKRIVPMPGYEGRSGKLMALGQLLEQCKQGGHRSLIFSQHTSMLDIIEHYLEAEEYTCLRLDGSTPPRSRQKLVDRFNKDSKIDTFLISTRAGGSGLNLVGADTVIFYDHDWNPANDLQAQDRAYRIGQKKVVNVYRLVSQGTLEEKILDRQRRKQDLADAIIKHDPSGFKNLTREDLLSLFEFNGE